jgi:hypothetical protein
METTTSTDKKVDKTTYMREYKRKQYLEKGNEIKQKNKAYYYLHKYKLPLEEIHKYDILLPNIVRLRKEIDEIKKKNPELIKELLCSYLSE